MRLKGRIQVNVSDYLTVDYYEGITIKKRASIIECTTRAKNGRLFDISQRNIKTTAIAERSFED